MKEMPVYVVCLWDGGESYKHNDMTPCEALDSVWGCNFFHEVEPPKGSSLRMPVPLGAVPV